MSAISEKAGSVEFVVNIYDDDWKGSGYLAEWTEIPVTGLLRERKLKTRGDEVHRA